MPKNSVARSAHGRLTGCGSRCDSCPESPQQKKKKKRQQYDNAEETPSVRSPRPLTPPPRSSPVRLGHFHSVCSSTPSPVVRATRRRHPIRRDGVSRARRSFGNELGGGGRQGEVGAPGASATQLRCTRGRPRRFGSTAERRPPRRSGKHGPPCAPPSRAIVGPTCSLKTRRCDKLRHYFLQTVFPVVPPCQTSVGAPSRCDS